MTPLVVRRPTCRCAGRRSGRPRARARTSRVTPYLNARGPPAFSATLPPRQQSSRASSIGRIEPAFAPRPPRGDRRAIDAGLDHGDAFAAIDLLDSRHARRREHDAARDRDGAARAPGAASPRSDGYLGFARDAARAARMSSGPSAITTAAGIAPSASDSSLAKRAQASSLVRTLEGPSERSSKRRALSAAWAEGRGRRDD